MSTRARQRIGYSTLVLMLLAFIVAVMASNVLLRGWRIDLTNNQLYTLSAGTRKVLQKIDEPINLYLFFSNQETQGLPALRAYATRVTETLQEFAANAKGKLVLHVVDPIPFSEDEDRAEQFGLQPAMVGDKNVYFGLAGSNSVGTTDTIPFFDPEPSKEAFLEYDLARLVYNLANPKKTVVGLLSGAPIGGSFDPQTQQPTQPWTIVEQARELFELRMLPESTLKIDDDINVLWIVHPAMVDDATQYAIDQFVMRGGRALIFVDPMAEILAAGQEPTGLAARAELQSRQAVQGLGRRVLDDGRRRGQPLRARYPAGPEIGAPRRPARARHGSDEQERRDHVGARLGQRRPRGLLQGRRRRDEQAHAAAAVEHRGRDAVRSRVSSSCPTRASS
jgi:ABC-type uncharacterized transport system involved in gliding motility auxiliary subunit